MCTFTVHHVTSRTSEHLSSQLTAGQDDPTLNLQYFMAHNLGTAVQKPTGHKSTC